MNKDQIMRAVENASDKQIKALAWLLGIDNESPIKVHGLTSEQLSVLKFFFVPPEQQQVPVTQRHVGCVVRVVTNPGEVDQISGPDLLIDRKDNGYTETISVSGYALSLSFPNTYRVPITHRWSGGECPVNDNQLVLFQRRNGIFEVDSADGFVWDHQVFGEDIIGYTPLDVNGVEDES